MADMPVRSHASNSSFRRAAPSSIEYSVCTCRCTKLPFAWFPDGAAAMKYRLFRHAAVRPALPPAAAPVRYFDPIARRCPCRLWRADAGQSAREMNRDSDFVGLAGAQALARGVDETAVNLQAARLPAKRRATTAVVPDPANGR